MRRFSVRIILSFFLLSTVNFTYGQENVVFNYTDYREEIKKGEALGIGTAEIISPEKVRVNSWETVNMRYTAGKAGIQPEGGVRFTMMHLHKWSTFQFEDPVAAAYTTIRCSNGAPVEIFSTVDKFYYDIVNTEYVRNYDPNYKTVEITVGEPGLKEGDFIDIVLGEKSGGSPGVLMQFYDEHPFYFEPYVDPLGDGSYYPMAHKPSIDIVAGDPARLNVILPSNAVVGQEVKCIVRAEDLYGNVAVSYDQALKLSGIEKEADIREKHQFSSEDQGLYHFQDIVFEKPGTYKLLASDGSMEAISNPIVVASEDPGLKVYWGDIHNHTKYCDGRGTNEQNYQFARDVSGLDFCSVSSHSENLRDEEWENSKEVTREFNDPGNFVTIPGYEWSGSTETGGDHNVYFLEDDPPIYRSRANFNYYSYNNYQGKAIQANHIEDLYLMLARHYTNKNIIVIPHYGGRKGNPNWHNPTLERLIEVYSDHQRSLEWVQEYLAAGHRTGIMASSDGHIGNPGYSITFPKTSRKDMAKIDWSKEEIGTSLIAVYAGEQTRESIFHSMYDRHCYGTTGDRILLDFRVNGHLMGSEIISETAPEIMISVNGTASIDKIEILRNNEVVKDFRPGSEAFEVNWTDNDFNSDKPSYYYTRVLQGNGEEAISSPVWIENTQ